MSYLKANAIEEIFFVRTYDHQIGDRRFLSESLNILCKIILLQLKHSFIRLVDDPVQ
jgi:hypothetical protein